ncbi:UTP--glucose-1-phosphate uridylyltransferase-like isoform X1 [Asterias rubens]|uniref:UTP--glucose-1-phosphate uridylyltransferase-like isoform X1 n=1 Tax=Asterias rubens TaxID=7604 RepID=UPI001455CCA0|nr:UTP--glucose-1-phosphate uridylyltransferase-like isoform X1 [Asterias rubens]
MPVFHFDNGCCKQEQEEENASTNGDTNGGMRRSNSQIAFHTQGRKDAQRAVWQEVDKLVEIAPASQKEAFAKEFSGFKDLFWRFLEETGPSVRWEDIQPLSKDAVIPYSSLDEYSQEATRELLDKLVVVKLNGGLGTSMGCTGPKSVISVRNDVTFLDLAVQQIEHLNKTYGSDVPLVLMNSFNTDEDTKTVLRRYTSCQVNIHTFMQQRFPRINKETLLPTAKSCDMTGPNMEHWYPPGHGDVYQSFYNSGLLDAFVRQGKEFMFISNIDNLGATVDLKIINLLMQQKNREFVMEVTDKTRADIKGGTLIQYENKLRLLEIAQVPKEHVDEFKSVSKFKIFNTNNLWIKLSSIKRLVEERLLNMEVIVNNKTLDSGLNVIQLETAVGAAMKFFDGALGINVPRRRFLPVKRSSDLLLVMSNLYSLKAGSLIMSPMRQFVSTPIIKLGTHFDKVRNFLRRFDGIPDILELDHLTVSGDVTFGKGITLKGTVIIIANHGDRIDIPPGAILENKIVSGNLRILDH